MPFGLCSAPVHDQEAHGTCPGPCCPKPNVSSISVTCLYMLLSLLGHARTLKLCSLWSSRQGYDWTPRSVPSSRARCATKVTLLAQRAWPLSQERQQQWGTGRFCATWKSCAASWGWCPTTDTFWRTSPALGNRCTILQRRKEVSRGSDPCAAAF